MTSPARSQRGAAGTAAPVRDARDVRDESTSSAQRHILAAVRAASEPVDVTAIAAAAGRHVNTVRFHLDRLVEAGLVDRTPEPATRPGRPRYRYFPRTGIPPAVDPLRYRALAEVLSGLLVSEVPRPAEAAVRAGRALGRQLVSGTAPTGQPSDTEAAGRLVRALEDVGFAGHLAPDDTSGHELVITHCPYRDMALTHGDIVCSIHLGMLEGSLAALRAPLAVDDFRPFATPERCIARLRRVEPEQPEQPRQPE